MQVNYKDALGYCETIFKAKLVPYISSSPGCGKSCLAQDLATKFKLKLIDLRLSQLDPTDLNGFGTITEGIAQYVPFNIFPLENTPIPKNKNGWLLFLDELPSAPLSVQAASFKLVLDHMVGQHTLHSKTAIMAAGNLSTDNAIVNKISTPMQSRLIHLELMSDPEEWLKWGNLNNIDYRILSYIYAVPDNLHKFDPNHNDKTFACERTWEFASKILSVIGSDDLRKHIPVLAGTLGEGVAREFVAYVQTLIDLPDIKEILANPYKAKLNTAPGLLYATAQMLTRYTNEKNIDKILIYTSRMPFEFETITMQNVLQKNKKLRNNTTVKKWLIEKGELLL